MNRLLRDFLQNLTLASLVLGMPVLFVVLAFYGLSLWGPAGFLFAAVITIPITAFLLAIVENW